MLRPGCSSTVREVLTPRNCVMSIWAMHHLADIVVRLPGVLDTRFPGVGQRFRYQLLYGSGPTPIVLQVAAREGDRLFGRDVRKVYYSAVVERCDRGQALAVRRAQLHRGTRMQRDDER